MSATAGRGAENRIDESASAAENAFRFGCEFGFSLLLLQWMMGVVGLSFEGSLGLRVVVGLERLVGMVRDIFFLWKERRGIDLNVEWSGEMRIEGKVFRFCVEEISGEKVCGLCVDKVRQVRWLTWIVVIGSFSYFGVLLLSLLGWDKRFQISLHCLLLWVPGSTLNNTIYQDLELYIISIKYIFLDEIMLIMLLGRSSLL